MNKLLSSRSSSIRSMPENYIFPVDSRPGEETIPFCDALPVINLLSCDRDNAVQQVLEACQEFGIFQLINHGVDEDLVSDTMRVVKEFFNMPEKDKEEYYSEDPNKKCRLFTGGYDYKNENTHLWRDTLRHPCIPLDECVPLWPGNPTRYRDVVRKYALEMGKLSSKILELLSEGLGLGSGYFGEDLAGVQNFSAHHYPPCPDPSLALGFPTHCDVNLISFILQDETYGLQVFRNEKWMGVRPIPNAFLVIVGLQAKIISNGKLASPPHRAITNSSQQRTSIISPIFPKPDSIIEPAKALINDSNQPIYRAFEYNEFFRTYYEKKDFSEGALEDFKVKSVHLTL
uniref:hyoscyamine 6-dioxygenase-like n=1 Tax=Erigeron canadensis TaxID=72917 RepID=UPI001CB96EDB|nr:hyoscyamine 6-dioxygenase-like [Erigeron canadensis]